MSKIRKTTTCFLLVLIAFISSFQIVFYDYLSLANQQSLAFEQGNYVSLPQFEWGNNIVQAAIHLNDEENTTIYDGSVARAVLPGEGSYAVDYSLFGIIPIKTAAYQVSPAPMVFVGGHSIGILLNTQGATVVGYAPILSSTGEAVYPAKDAGIEIGDFLIKINGEEILTDEQVATVVQKCSENNQKVTLTLKREGQEYNFVLEPAYCYDSNSWRIGLYIRDNTAGVGTLTFATEEGAYGALGHMVSDAENKLSTEETIGSIVEAKIQNIQAGVKGEPGEKNGVFVNGVLTGTIEKNTVFGIFGQLTESSLTTLFTKILPVAAVNEIEEGPATIFTVTQGQKIESYEIKIISVLSQHQSSGKGLVIEVTDEDLLAKSGGIVQGMSGSPIIQNNKLVGAVTHVFVNDPTKGYGCLAEWMFLEINSTNAEEK